MGKLTKEEMAQLAPYESHLRNAVYSQYMITPGRTAIKLMDGIYHRVTGSPLRTDATCASCIMNVLTRLGRIYFAQKAEDEAKGAEEVEKPRKRRKTTKKE